MRTLFSSLGLSVSAVALSACAPTMQDDVASAGEMSAEETADKDVAESKSADAKLFELFAESDEANLKRNPIEGLFRGDMRYADQFGDYISDEYYAQEKAADEADLAALHAIDRSKLSETGKIAYDVFEFDKNESLKGYDPAIFDAVIVRPINHFSGFHTFYPTFASGTGAAPFDTVEDYENNLKRHKGFILLQDRSIGRFREGMASGVVETKLTIRNVIDQLDAQLALGVEGNSLYAPVLDFPEDFSEADKTRLTAEYKVATKEVLDSFKRLRDFLKDEYLPVARENTALSAMKGGAKLYDFMIEQTTTLDLDADYIHNLGLSEVARITAEMESIKDEVGFKGTLNEFFDYIRTDPKFKKDSREALTEDFYRIGEEVDERIGSLFSTLPKAPLEIRPYPPETEKFEAGGSYQQGTPDGSRPGVFYFNAYDLPSRTTPGNTSLYLHEGAPGHHFQISLAQENKKLPAFMRFGGNTAYVEGWGLYAETLGYPMGLYEDPYARFGHLDAEMLRAMRLVVDTGLHSKGWSRDKAIQYMLDNSSMGKTDATAEVERYIAIPSQALAYKIGALKIQELRDKAKAALGDKFDIKAFHEQVLGTGALPLAVLEKKIDDWIAAGGG